MSFGVTPGPLAWSFVGSVVLVLVLSSSANDCCAEERGPITNCSFSHNQETFLCDVADLGVYLDTCPDGRSIDLNDVPAPIDEDSFSIKPYFTSCSPNMHAVDLDASSCHTPCQDNVAVHAGLNITFRAEQWTSESLRAIAISLRYQADVYVHCVVLEFSGRSLTNTATGEHEFYYDGFIGLVPGGKYTVGILTLPTNVDWSNSVSKLIQIPPETCWVPDVKFHDTPFAVNLTLFQDLLYNFTQFDVILYHNPDRIISVDFSTAELYEMDGKWGTNIIFDCIEPSTEKFEIYITSLECIYCDWNLTRIEVKGVPPTFSNCPDEDIVHEIEMRKFMSDITINVSWLPPTPIFQSNCVYGHNSTHHPNTSLFEVGRTTPVTYNAWQYASAAQCTFNVDVRTVDTISPRITDCPDNINALASPKTKTLEITWPTPTYDDVSDTTMTIVSPEIPDSQNHYNFPVGTNTTVTYTITDAYNNVANCSFSVYVEEKPTASTLVIVLSCSAGLLLILILALLFWCRPARICTSQDNSDHTDSREHDCDFTLVNGSCQGIDLDRLKACHDSQFSVNRNVTTQSGHQIYPKGRSISFPDNLQHSSGYGSNIGGEFLPSFGHPRSQDPSCLDSLKEEDNNLLVWMRVDSNNGGMYSSGSHSSTDYDDSPVSMESTC